MNLEEELRSAFKEETTDLLPPPELKVRIMDQVTATQGGRRMKKWLLPCILAAALLIPTGAYAAYNYLADSIYGSQENFAQFGGTQQKYDELESKLQKAKHILSEEDFTTFMPLLKDLRKYNQQIADHEGVLHPEQLSTEEQEIYAQLGTDLEPFFDKINVQESPRTFPKDSIFLDIDKAKKILSKEEFTQFDNILTEIEEISQKSVDSNGELSKDRLSDTDKVKLDQLSQSFQPYLDKLDIKRNP